LSISKLYRKKSIENILSANLAGSDHAQMKRDLKVRDLTSFGIAAIIGAGIFSTVGTAAFYGGPAVSLLFFITAIACGFSALCYAEFASAIPISGSAYTYAYASFGELIAWIIGWDLIMEYTVGNIAVAISWSDYFTSFLNGIGIHFPDFLSMDYRTAFSGHQQVIAMLGSGKHFSDITLSLQQSFNAWHFAPKILGIPIIIDLPAFAIVFFITWLVYVGIYESKVASNIMVLLKLIVLMIVIGIGSFYVNPGNWNPFAPNGLAGVLKGVSGVFFAYIGFDAISTTAEECKNPQKDIPKAMILTLIITTLIYVFISLVLTGMVNYKELGVADPLAYVFQKLHLTWLSGIIALSAIIAMAGVLLVFQVGQPRIWMSMSRDGLLPKIFSKLHIKYRTPAFATVVTGLAVAIPTIFVSFNEVIDLTSIGTLFAFVLVSGGVLMLDDKDLNKQNSYKIPFISSRLFIFPIWIIVFILIWKFNSSGLTKFFQPDFTWDIFKHKIPMITFIIVAFIITLFCIIRNLSLIPVISLLANFYLMTELGITNWMRFLIWLIIGLVIYFVYSIKKSKLNQVA
jgi:basic amino acid/polyamine antiporter, APA family